VNILFYHSIGITTLKGKPPADRSRFSVSSINSPKKFNEGGHGHMQRGGMQCRGTSSWIRRSWTLVMVVALVLSAAVLQPAAAQQPRTGGVLRVATIGEPPMLDIQATTATITSNLAYHWMETLFTFDENWVPRPFLVEDYLV